MALQSTDVDVRAVTVVSGNVEVDQGVANARFVVELCGSSAPVHRGADRPLKRAAVYAHFFHGRDGLGDQGFAPADPSPASNRAVDVLIEEVKAEPGLTLVTLGPLTNIALALEQAPEIAGSVGRCVVMGGAACTVGNITPAAEFNLWVDPDAADVVFRSGLPIEMVGWELCRGEANLDADDVARIRRLETPTGHFTIDCNRTAAQANLEQAGEDGIPLPDPVAMAVALDPSICTRSSSHYVRIETESELTRGMTVVDQLDVTHDERNAGVWGELRRRPPNVRVCWEIDAARWKALLFGLLQE